MDGNKTWTVVQFLRDQSVEAIPTGWIEDENCYWPPYKQDKLSSAIRKCEQVHSSWPKYEIKLFKNAKFDDYAKARVKAKKAETCSSSDLRSDTEEGKRKRLQKTLSTSSDEVQVNMPYKPPRLPTKKPEFKTTVEDNDNNDKSSESDKSLGDSELDSISKGLEVQRLNEATGIQASGSCCFYKEHEILHELKAQNHMMRGILTDVLSEIRDLKLKGTGNEVVTSLFVKYSNLISFPIKNDEDFQKFETEMQDEQNFIEAVKELAKFGGSNPYNFIKRSMSAVLSDNIIVKYSWLGRKSKKRLEGTAISKLFLSAADKLGIPNQKVVEDAIKSYIKRGPERLNAKENKKL